MKIQAKMVADSLSPQKHRLSTMLITFPRFILAELNTHRMLSKNSASSRAIPFAKMVKSVQENPFIPIAWQKDHKGMQGTEYIKSSDSMPAEYRNFNRMEFVEGMWLKARDEAVYQATQLQKIGEVTKQLCNRLLEPFMYHTVLISGTEFSNFFDLRCPDYQVEFPYSRGQVEHFKSRKDYTEAMVRMMGDEFKEDERKKYNSYTDLDWLKINKGQAEIHMMALAEAMWDCMNESKPKLLSGGQWHIPFFDKIDLSQWDFTESTGLAVKISTAMAARTSYTVVGDEKEVSYETLIGIHDRIINAIPRHSSPMEHCAIAQDNSERFFNLQGFKSYRYILDNSK